MIRKELTRQPGGEEEAWLDLVRCATFEVTSEEAAHPLENALTPDSEKWIASTPASKSFGSHSMKRRTFRGSFFVRRDCHSSKPGVVLAWLPAGQSTWQEGVRFNFGPPNTTQERENFTVWLERAATLELRSGKKLRRRASLSQLLIS